MSGTVRSASRRAAGSRPRWLAPVAAAAVPVVLATLALLYPGVPVSQVDLNDGSVWLTNTSALKLGRYNPAIEELNAGLIATAAEFDVLQDAGDVLLTEAGKVSTVDPASVTLTSQTTVPFGAKVTMAAGTVAVADASGNVWARTMTMIGSLSVDSQDPDLELGTGGGAVVARDGTVLAAKADGTLLRGEVGVEEVDVEEAGTLAGEPSGGFDQVTAVGDQLVALAGRTLHTPRGSVDLSAYGEGLTLQQPGPRATSVLVASRTALLEISLDGTKVHEHETGGTGRPAAPVVVGACGHGAWASATGSYVQLCRGSDPEITDLQGMTSTDTLVFRVNRDVVVLNDTLRGRLWVPMEDPELREPNWQDIEPDEETQQDDEESESRQSTENLQAECSAQSSSPLAADDEFGVRAGRTMVLSVIDNDASSDCGILAISEFDPLPAEFGTLVAIHGGRSFQLTTTAEATGTAEFTYTITDGRGTSAPSTATARLTVRDPAQNSGPEQLRVGSVIVEQGGTVTYDVLPDFRDPDGDHLILAGAAAEGGGTVRTRQDGELTYTSDGGTLGRQTVHVQVSDGTETAEGTLLVDVRPAGSVTPVIDPVHAVTYVDEPVVVSPLKSVRSASREPVRLAGVDELPGLTLTPDLPGGTFTVTGARAGTYYVSFLITASPQQATGIARIDVLERPEVIPPPTAVLDTALLPPGGEVTVDPLANDVDPAGGVLVVQSVEVPAETGLQIAVLNHRLLRITSTRVLEAPVTARYTISNGAASATGEVVILPIPASATQQPPVVPNVSVSVRTGGVVTIPVLEGAYDPDGDPLTLLPELAEGLGSGEGLMFVSGDVLRYQAPDSPLQTHATFNVSDPAKNVTAATVTVDVHTSDPASKAPPRPEALTARVFTGETVRIPVPLTGIDPDGDGVYLLGQDQAPTKGRIVAQGADWLEYEALPGEVGTDTFTYAVEDWVGQRAVATVQVGIAARPTTSAEVVSRNDDVTVRPGQSVEVRVLANDTDTGGGELTLQPELEVPEGVEAEVVGRRIVVQTPNEPGVVQIAYTATNERGGSGGAVLTVTVDPDAPVLPPVAQDVVVPATETINRTTVEVDVLEVAQNPSGPLSDLAVSVDGSVADVATVNTKGNVVVTLIDRAQTLPYLLTNTNPAAGGLKSYAFITVPALGDFPPMLRPGAPELVVIAGEQLRVSLAEQVQVAPGRTAVISDVAKVTATKSDGSSLVADNQTLTYTPQRSYAGPASISFEVADANLADPTVRTKVLTLPVTVLAAEDYPPVFTPSVLDVGPGETTSVDLAVFTSDPVGTAEGGARYTYRLSSPEPAGFQVSITGTTLTVTAGPTVPKGTVGGVGIDIGYGTDSKVEARVDFKVVASKRQLARVVDHAVPDGVEGGASTITVLTGAYNPFPESPMTVVDAVVETPGAGTAGITGNQVTVRPAAGFIGQMVTRYRVRDVTGDPDREVEGRITVTVRGRPAAPTAPRVVEVRDRTVVLAWDAPANNGEPITGYRLTAQPGGIAKDCASTTCTVENLTNNTEYTFTVTAQNAVGASDASPPSGPARPDAKPSAPAAPELVWGDRSVTASWTAPANTGSPIVRYELQISPTPPGGAATVSTPGTSQTFTGLTNGVEYRVQVRAINLAPEPGDWSPQSQPQVPAGLPGAPVDVRATNERIGWLGQGSITVTWAPGDANGDAVATYDVQVDGAVVATLDSSQTSYTHTDVQRGRDYQLAVRARNKAGVSPWAGTTGRVWSAPSAPTGLGSRDGDVGDRAWGEGEVVLNWSAPSDTGGADLTITDYRIDGPGYARIDGTSAVISGLTAGVDYTFRVQAINSRRAEGEWATFPVVRTTTAPAAPTITADTTTAGEGTVTWGAVDGGEGIDGWDLKVDGRSVPRSQWASDVSYVHQDVDGGEIRVEVRARNLRGWGAWASLPVTINEVPEPDPDPGP